MNSPPLRFRLRAVWMYPVLFYLVTATAFAQPVSSSLTPLPLDDLSAFAPTDSANWVIVGAVSASHTEDRAMQTRPGAGILANTETENGRGANLFTNWTHGDLELELDFLMPKASNSGIYLQGRYEIQLFDSWGADPPRHSDAGGIYQRWDASRPEGERGFEGHPPAVNVSRAPGLWQHFRIVFRAPRFDAQGQKTENARFLEVWHNGVLVHEDVELTGPTRAAAYEDEAAEGPLMVQGDHGPVAFRNIRYKRLIPERVELADLRYAYYEGEWEGTRPDLTGLEPRDAGPAETISWDKAEARADFALAYEGRLLIPEGGTYSFRLAVDGAGSLSVDGRNVLRFDERRGPDEKGVLPPETGSMYLTEGAHPFRLEYVKNSARWFPPRLFLDVQSPAMPWHALSTPPDSYARERPTPITVEVGDRPYPFRAFIDFDGGKRTHALAVGDPTGTHYAMDLNRMALLYVWKGPFLDARPMWEERGEAQTPEIPGAPVQLSGLPTVASLERPSDPWPDSLDAFAFNAYTLDDDGRAVFHYTIDGVEIADRIEPQEGGRYLRRTLSFSADTDRSDFWVLLARAPDQVEARADGAYSIGDGEYLVVVGPDVIEVDTRATGDAVLLVAPVRFRDGRGTLTYDLIW